MDSQFSCPSLGSSHCGAMRVFLLWLVEGRNHVDWPTHCSRVVSHLCDVDMVQPWIWWFLANRSWIRAARTSRSALLYLGSTVPARGGGGFFPFFWQSHRIDSPPAHFSLFVAHQFRWQRGDQIKQHYATTSQKRARLDLFYSPTSNPRDSNSGV